MAVSTASTRTRRPIALVVHGAHAIPEGLADMQVALHRNRFANQLVGLVDFRVVDWRNASGIRLGPAELTLPKPRIGSKHARWSAAKHFLSRQTAAAVTDLAEADRWQIIRGISDQLMGEILSYNRHRPRIRKVLDKELANIDADTIVAVGHSLGGIILLDMLSEKADSRVKALVTVGSQGPIMYAFDALAGIPLTPGGPQRPFTPWYNVWDRRDLLSFVAAPIFNETIPEAWEIYDIEVASGEPFPRSHSAYWTQRGTWLALRLAVESAQGTLKGHLFAGALTVDELEEFFRLQLRRKADTANFEVAEFSEKMTRLRRAIERRDAEAIRRIDAGKAKAVRVRGTGSEYYKVQYQRYALTTGRLDLAGARAIIERYKSLRDIPLVPNPRLAAEARPDAKWWLTLVAGEPDEFDGDARVLLGSEGIWIVFRSHLAAEHGL